MPGCIKEIELDVSEIFLLYLKVTLPHLHIYRLFRNVSYKDEDTNKWVQGGVSIQIE